MTLVRLILTLATVALLGACSPPQEMAAVPEPLGDFKLGYNIVVVDNPELLPFTRKATDAEWKAALEKAIAERFGRFQGTGEYHVALKLHAYALAQPGVPIVASPKSVLVVAANVWRPTGKINPEPENLTVWEGVNGKNVLGSGLTQTKEEQMAKLAFNTALKVEDWFRSHPEWFVPGGPVVPGTEPVQPQAN
jgi:hypothetical protein